MPTFDFRCLSCEAVFEHMVPFGKKASPMCPSCGKKKTEKLLTPPAVVFKGAGWYKTDSRPAAKKPVEAPASAKTASDAKKPDAPAATEMQSPQKETKKKSQA